VHPLAQFCACSANSNFDTLFDSYKQIVGDSRWMSNVACSTTAQSASRGGMFIATQSFGEPPFYQAYFVSDRFSEFSTLAGLLPRNSDDRFPRGEANFAMVSTACGTSPK
jgi:hypothetical protein